MKHLVSHSRLARLAALLAAGCAAASPVQAAELKVLTAGAYKPVLLALAPGFEQRTGHQL
jgi:molybdate transport system substrate-binding protein